MKSVTIERVPLDILISALQSLYEQGVDFVDIIGKKTDNEDRLGIAIQENYLSEGTKPEDVMFPEMNLVHRYEYRENDNEECDNDISPLDEDDLNKLI